MVEAPHWSTGGGVTAIVLRLQLLSLRLERLRAAEQAARAAALAVAMTSSGGSRG